MNKSQLTTEENKYEIPEQLYLVLEEQKRLIE